MTQVSRWFSMVGLTLLQLGVMLVSPVWGAEEIFLRYGPLEFSLDRESLENYAYEGEVGADLAPFTRRLTWEQQAQLREVLKSRADLDAVAVSQFFYSTQGEAILELLGQVIQTRKGQSGFYALRSALILAAASEEGLTPLSVIQAFPTREIQINSAFAFELLNQVSQRIAATEDAIAMIQEKAQQSAQHASNRKFPLNLGQAANFPYTKETLLLNDVARRRAFFSDLYLPQVTGSRRLPLIVISHGLGSNRQTYAYLAQHLASHGFAVAVPEHSGSNAQQLEALAAGLARDISPPQEFLDRPLDVKFLLDQLAQTYRDRLNTQNVGIIGQSFGGYTALALAGASLNFEQLQQDCQESNLSYSLNLSILLQCPAQTLSSEQTNFRDERIKAAFAINPVTSRIFGDTIEEIKIPVAVVTSSDDTVAPALPEQIQPYQQLTSPDKYLILLENGTHFSTLGGTDADVELPEQVVGPDPKIAYEYMQALSLAFFGTHLLSERPYEAYLNSAYTQRISQEEMPLWVINN
ncbi:alpha/beta hydrolase [Spirulina sp. CS-785/01]|uniref:alpha/beta hydrolase n=1 Tax=Spirulina sp. CS-785/01 TaxID=3021716 RepID=UPI00232AEECE|nr:alpha/beta hydrolase [Spirulina sp. CS-785/01]MDB9314359.1 alpha/beta hydrolase [Spirulina sp. CS-785/01]